jgi:hypothetical protein
LRFDTVKASINVQVKLLMGPIDSSYDTKGKWILVTVEGVRGVREEWRTEPMGAVLMDRRVISSRVLGSVRNRRMGISNDDGVQDREKYKTKKRKKTGRDGRV